MKDLHEMDNINLRASFEKAKEDANKISDTPEGSMDTPTNVKEQSSSPNVFT